MPSDVSHIVAELRRLKPSAPVLRFFLPKPKTRDEARTHHQLGAAKPAN